MVSWTGASNTETTEENNPRVIPLQEMDSIVDADMAMLDNNRLHFYRRVDSEYILFHIFVDTELHFFRYF